MISAVFMGSSGNHETSAAPWRRLDPAPEGPLTHTPAIVPVVLCGGAGTRLWPLSRRARPKQLLPLATERSLLDDTLRRCEPFGDPVLIGADAQRFLLQEAVRRAGRTVRLLAEPSGRNTAAAAAVAALDVQARLPGSLVLLVPADHRIDDADAFRRAVLEGAPAAREGRIVVFGVRPTSPHTGYGWIEGEPGAGVPPAPDLTHGAGREPLLRHERAELDGTCHEGEPSMGHAFPPPWGMLRAEVPCCSYPPCSGVPDHPTRSSSRRPSRSRPDRIRSTCRAGSMALHPPRPFPCPSSRPPRTTGPRAAPRPSRATSP
ncbi:MAG: NTP transferase domain-containing protein [Myxococcales bacterium]|nr:NTP transferase domain-containing protein [Myxococcales bacterium]